MIPVMRAALVIVIAAAAAALLFTTASLGQPPPLAFDFALTSTQPVAGTMFTGLVITPSSGTRIASVRCTAKVGRKVLPGRLLRYFAPQVTGPAAVSCSWRIPAKTRGKTLRVRQAYAVSSLGQERRGGPFSWRIKP
jgi:hypothetical protein